MESGEEATGVERAFWLLSDETRIAILRALWAAEDDVVSFSDLREAVGNPNSGQFNYHLGKLGDHFVSKGDGGYELTQAGREVVRAVLAGSITDQPTVGPEPIDGTCTECGAGLAVRYDEYGIVECPDCGATVMWNEFPPAGLVDRTPAEVAAAFDAWTRNRFQLAMDGICPSCAGETSTEIRRGDEGDISTTHRCENCEYEARAPLFGHVISHPAVVSFYYDHGVDVTDLPYWEIRALARDLDETVTAEDPLTVTIAVEMSGDRLEVTLDGELAVTDLDRPTD